MTEENRAPSNRVYVRDFAEDTRRWLAHRFGEQSFEASIPGPLTEGRALELNSGAEELLAEYGKREIEGCVAFVDLKGFSTAVQGKSAKGIHDFVAPFLQGVTAEAVGSWCLVDKTIGDEIMIVQPNMTDAAAPPSWFLMGRVLSGLAQLQRQLGPDYRFRIGLAYGSLYLGRVGADSYKEWTVFGEAVHLAKRLHGLDGLDSIVADRGLAVAFGILDRDLGLPGLANINGHPLNLMLEYVNGAYFDYRKLDKTQELKGVSSYTAAVLIPNAALDAISSSEARSG